MAVSNKHKVLSPSNLNIIGLNEDVSPDTANDYLATYDASSGSNKKVLLDNLGLGGGNAFTIMQPDAGTSPTADSDADTLTFTSSDSSITITGDSTTDELDFIFNNEDVELTASATSTVPLTLTALASHTADLLSVEDSSSTRLIGITADGDLTFTGGSTNSDLTMFRSDATDHGISFYGPTGNRETWFRSDSFSISMNKGGMAQYTGAGAYKTNGFGSSANTMFGHRADLDSGLYGGGVDDVRLCAGGNDGIVCTSTGTEIPLPLSIPSDATTSIPLTVSGIASQTADLLLVEDSASAHLVSIASDGKINVEQGASTTDPTILAEGESNLGIVFYNTGSNGAMGFLAGTSYRFDFTKNGATAYSIGSGYAMRSDPNGSTSGAAFGFRADTNTGMYRVSADNLGFTSGGTQTMQLSTTIVESKLPLMVPAYATGSLPTASSYAQCIVYDSTTNEFKGSDGTSWNVLG